MRNKRTSSKVATYSKYEQQYIDRVDQERHELMQLKTELGGWL